MNNTKKSKKRRQRHEIEPSKTIVALQKEVYNLKARVADLEQQIYLMDYKPKQL